MDTCIATVLNDFFAEYFFVFLHSLKKHNPWFESTVKILWNRTLSPLSPEHRQRILKLHCNTEFVEVNDAPYHRFFPVTPIRLHPALLKLEIFNLTECNSLIFFDSDLLCLGDLTDLFSLDVPFAACPAGKNRELKERVANSYRFRVGFNTGVMVIGKKHLDGRTYQKLLGSKLLPCPTADQDILNRFFRWKRIYCLDHRYNYHAKFFWEGDETGIKILHYAGEKPLEKPAEPRMRIWFRYRDELNETLSSSYRR